MAGHPVAHRQLDLLELRVSGVPAAGKRQSIDAPREHLKSIRKAIRVERKTHRPGAQFGCRNASSEPGVGAQPGLCGRLGPWVVKKAIAPILGAESFDLSLRGGDHG